MKLRQGFVSNSSSSSYIVSLNGVSFKKLIEILQPDFQCDLLNKKIVLKDITQWISKFTEYKETSMKSEGTMVSVYDRHITKLLDFKKRLETTDDIIDIARIILEYNMIEVEETYDYLKLSYTTSMHNDFDSGMHEMLKEIILYLLFETDIIPYCERESDDIKEWDDEREII